MSVGSDASIWFPLVFPILFPIVFPMGLMLFFMMRRGGPMGMMMGGRPGRSRGDVDRPPRRSRGDRGEPEGRGDRESGGSDLEGGGDPAGGAGGGSDLESPLEVARRRYAAGEISREEFWRIREDLGPR